MMLRCFLFIITLLVSSFVHAEASVIELGIPVEKSVNPDLAYLNVEILSKEKTAKEAQSKLKQQLSQLQKIVEAEGFKLEDLVTERHSFGPEYEWDQTANKNKLVGYAGSHQLKLFVRQIDQLAKLLDLMANVKISVLGIDWDYKNKTLVEDELIVQAIEKLKARAEIMAKAAGVKIKGIHQLSHQSFGAAPLREQRGMMKSMALDREAGPVMNPGEVKIRVQVNASFEIAN